MQKFINFLFRSKHECIKAFEIRNQQCSIDHSSLTLPKVTRYSPALLIDRLFKESQPVAKMLVSQRSFRPTESIKFGISIQNTSSHPVSSIEVYLLQVITFSSSSRTKKDEDKFGKIKLENQVKARSSHVFSNISMQIPSSESKFLATTSCSLIKVQHYLALAFKFLNQKQQRALAPICIQGR